MSRRGILKASYVPRGRWTVGLVAVDPNHGSRTRVFRFIKGSTPKLQQVITGGKSGNRELDGLEKWWGESALYPTVYTEHNTYGGT